jgi:ABC-type Fe3+ transport system permease subunit
MTAVLVRALVIWLILLALAVVNGGAREAWMVPRLGDRAAHALSTGILCTLIALTTWLAIGWIRPATVQDALVIGALWLSLTLGFEFLVGHYVFGTPWAKLLADYNLLRGRIWMLVLVVTLLAPVWAARARGLVP